MKFVIDVKAAGSTNTSDEASGHINDYHEPSKFEILDDIREAVKELNLVLSGKKAARDADELLSEL